MTFYSTDELLLLPNQSWLIRGLLPETGMSLIFGPPGEGKSFVSIDWALSVSTGLPWLGQYPTKQGHVVYIAAEGGRGIKKRVAAWMQHHGVETHELSNITWYLDTLDVRAEDSIEDFILQLNMLFPAELVQHEGELVAVNGLDLKLVVIDTLSRNFGGADENASEAMSSFVNRLDLFSKQHGAAVLVVHHTNALGARERGHSSLKGSVEASFHCTAVKEGGTIQTISLENNKQKDDKDEDELFLTPVRVEVTILPPNEDGDPLTSLVLTCPTQDSHDDILNESSIETLQTIVAFLHEHPRSSDSAIIDACRAHQRGRNETRQALTRGVRGNTLTMARGPRNAKLYSLYETPSSGSWVQRMGGE